MHFNNKGELDNYLRQNTGSYLSAGRKSSLFLIDGNKCLKLFGCNTVDDSVLKFIKDEKLSNYYELYDLLYYKNKLIGYIMEYYNNKAIDILTMPTEYTLDNYNSLYKSILTLTKNNILLGDLCKDNIIYTKDKLIVIDADEYTINNNISNYILENDNLFSLESLFNSIYLNARNLYHSDDNIDINKVNNLFCVNSPHKILKKYKYPIDYLKENNYDNK